METLDNQSFSEGSSTNLPPDVVNELQAATPWMKFIAILGFIYCAFVVLTGLFALVASGGESFFGFLLSLGFVAILFFISLFLMQYAIGINKYSGTKSHTDLLLAFTKQKAYWRLVGIFTIVMLALVIIGIIIALVAGSYFFPGFGF